ncbi:hypothetical protein [Proteiniborus sp. MB09-C3]|nr:hypothetical protein [Proteiniborus sp. MB09-C3]WIV11769.1 hypothetical protein QO263_16955 [Proteiniborus sp. MB09-C3]
MNRIQEENIISIQKVKFNEYSKEAFEQTINGAPLIVKISIW